MGSIRKIIHPVICKARLCVCNFKFVCVCVHVYNFIFVSVRLFNIHVKHDVSARQTVHTYCINCTLPCRAFPGTIGHMKGVSDSYPVSEIITLGEMEF